MKLSTFLIVCSLSFTGSSARAAVETATGIPLDTAWKEQVYAFAQKNVVHPSWGLAHSERDYQVAKRLADSERIAIDLDVLFAAAFLHDLGGLDGFATEGVDHAARSVELIEPLLRDWGFPMAKWPDVKDMILGHTYYGALPANRQSLAFRDADVLDFLGAMGIARILAVTEEAGRASPTLAPSIDTLKKFKDAFPAKLSLKASRREAVPLVEQMRRYFKELEASSLGGKAL